MSFFSRKVPTNRNYIMFVGLRSILEHMKQFNHHTISQIIWELSKHPMIGPVLAKHADIFSHLRFDDFNLMSMREGTLAFAGPGYREDGTPFVIHDKHINVYEPYMQAETSFILSKLIETPWLSYINYESMVASKAARVVSVAQGKPVLEFGQRRTHPKAAIDASYAAYIAGCAGTSNVAAFIKYGIPAVGTMDHFAVMASEQESKNEAELSFFNGFAEVFPNDATLLIDTYNAEQGIKNAMAATKGKLKAIRIDSNVSISTIRLARKLLDSNNCSHVKIFVSDGLNERKVQELAPYADGFGVGENITCSPDSATGVGAVGKLTVNGYGKKTIKISQGSGKMTLPGPVQVFRTKERDIVGLLGERFDGEELLTFTDGLPSLEETREFAKTQMASLSPEFKNIDGNPYTRKIIVSDKFAELTLRLVNEG
jgi:nicotinate phosphoribosyltransferase